MPGDVPVGAVSAPVEAVTPAKVVHPFIAAREAKAAKMVSLSAGLAKLKSEMPTEDVAAPTEPVEKAAEATKSDEGAPVEKLNEEPKVEAKPVEAKPDEPDETTKRGLAAVEKAQKKFRDEQIAAKASLDVERAEIARLRAEAQGKVTSIDEIKKLKPRDILDKLGLDEDAYDVVAREAWARTKAGKADPKAQAAAEQSSRERAYSQELAELKAKYEELSGEFTKRDKQAEVRATVTRWQDDAVKAIPADKPTLISKLHAKSPEKARAALLAIGQQLERDNDNATPTVADAIAAYEKTRRAELEDQGVDVEAMLATPKPPAKAAPKTLDLASPASGTRPINGSPTKEQRLASISAGLRTLND